MTIRFSSQTYENIEDFPNTIPLFPLKGALLLPKGQLPLTIFEPHYVNMVDAAIASTRLIGIVQPAISAMSDQPEALCEHGCLGRIISFSEANDQRYQIVLFGIARFKILKELDVATSYRQAQISVEPFLGDLDGEQEAKTVDRNLLLSTFRDYLTANNLDADWEAIHQASTESLVNALSMISPYGPAEKQALLEAPDLKTRAETLIAITEMELAQKGTDSQRALH